MSVRLEAYKAAHKPLVTSWLQVRELRVSLSEELPEHGYVAYSEEYPVAAGFTRRCEGNFWLLDSFISNPTVSSSIRDRAIQLLGETLIEDATQAGVRQVIVISEDPNTIQRAIDYKFIPCNFKVLVKRTS